MAATTDQKGWATRVLGIVMPQAQGTGSGLVAFAEIEPVLGAPQHISIDVTVAAP